MPSIRSFLIACAFASLAPMIDATPADAQAAACRPWCRDRSDGARNCGSSPTSNACRLRMARIFVCPTGRARRPGARLYARADRGNAVGA